MEVSTTRGASRVAPFGASDPVSFSRTLAKPLWFKRYFVSNKLRGNPPIISAKESGGDAFFLFFCSERRQRILADVVLRGQEMPCSHLRDSLKKRDELSFAVPVGFVLRRV